MKQKAVVAISITWIVLGSTLYFFQYWDLISASIKQMIQLF